MIHSILPKPREIQVEEGFYQGGPERTEQICDDSLETEGYRLKIGAQAIEMRAKTQAGFYYAEQTLRQLQRQNGGKLPLCEIVDAPVFAHRGFMLDCVRHFFPVTDLKRLIEAAARMKLNRFHWHLTDDQAGASRSAHSQSSRSLPPCAPFPILAVQWSTARTVATIPKAISVRSSPSAWSGTSQSFRKLRCRAMHRPCFPPTRNIPATGSRLR